MWERRHNKVSMVTALETWKIEEWFFVKKRKKKERGWQKETRSGRMKGKQEKKDIRKEADDMKLKEKLIKLATSGKGNEQ